MLHGVVQQVGQCPPDQRRVDACGGVAFDVQGQPGNLEQQLEEITRGRHFLGQRNLTGLHGDVTLPGTRQEQHVVDDGTQPFQFFQVGLHHLLQLSVVARPRQRHLRLAHQPSRRV
ncbi:hypothetical protein G6F24_017620 [Rhizopus arrhizus]|nr:hypothetical protein G6F24_017620 [Rhizopus arrhizus]